MKPAYLALAAVAFAVPCLAQGVISAKAGLVHVVEGDAYLNDVKLAPKMTEFPDIKQGEVLRTAEGRVEVLLSPGSFLRVGEDSSFKMISTSLLDVRVEVLKGRAMLEVDDMVKDTPIVVVLKDASVSIKKAGLYRFEDEPYGIKVYDGEAVVQTSGQSYTLKNAKSLTALNGQWTVQKFDNEVGDDLYRWSKRRAGYLAMANVSAARMARMGDLQSGYLPVSGYYGMGLPMGWSAGNWIYNPYFGMYTYVPLSGYGYSPWGYPYYSPSTVNRIYANTAPVYSRGGGINGSTVRSYTPSSSGSSYNSSLGYMSSGGRDSGFGSYSSGSTYSSPAPTSAASTGSAAASGGSRGGSASAGGASSGGGRGH